MAIPSPDTGTAKNVVVSTEGLNLDEWQSVNINSFIPEIFQDIIDTINEITNAISTVVDMALTISRMIAALTSEIFNLLKAIIESLKESIFALLDILPNTDAGIYMLWIPTRPGGMNYFTNTFTGSLVDRNDLRRPPKDDTTAMRAMFLLWGYPTWDKERQQQVREISSSFTSFFSFEKKVPKSHETPPPIDFAVEKGFFTKSTPVKQSTANTVVLPDNVAVDNDFTGGINDAGNAVSNILRTSIDKIVQTNPNPGVAANITWDIPSKFGAFSRAVVEYSYDMTPNKDNTETHSFKRKETKLIGIDILRAATTETKAATTILKEVMPYMQMSTSNSFLGEGVNYQDHEEDFLQGTRLIHHSLLSLPGSDYFIDILPDPNNTEYAYASNFVYEYTFSSVLCTKYPDNTVTVHHILENDIGGAKLFNSPGIEELDGVDFSLVDPKKVSYPKSSEISKWLLPSQPSINVVVPKTAITYTNSGAQPDWASFKLLEDLLPQLQFFVDRAKLIVENILDGFLDDARAIENWILEQVEGFQSMLQEVQDLNDLLQGLIFPPMAGLHFLDIETIHGMNNVVERYERALSYGLPSNNGDYNPLLLDNGFQEKYPEEYARRVDIPAYDDDHNVGGFVIVAQDPRVQGTLYDLLGLGVFENYTDRFQQIKNDTRLQIKNLRLPEFKAYVNITHPLSVLSGEVTSPSAYQDDLSRYKSGTDLPDVDVNGNGNVQVGSAPGPFLNDGPPTWFAVTCSQGFNQPPATHGFIVPHGVVSAEAIVSLMGCNASVVDDGSFIIEGKSLKYGGCSGAAAALFGLPENVDLAATDPSIGYEGEQFEYSAGDYLIEFVNNGRPTTEMKRSTPPIFQLNQFQEEILGPNSHNIIIDIEGNEQTVDVTGNAGTNPQNTRATWNFEATFPLDVVAGVNDQFNFQILGAPTEYDIDENINLITIRPLLYNSIEDLSSAILIALSNPTENVTPPPVYNTLYPLGTFTTRENGAGADLVVVDSWGATAGVTLNVTPGTNDLITDLDVSAITPGTDKVPYLLDDIITRLNSAFLDDYFTQSNDTVRITGKVVGRSSKITVVSNRTSLEAIESAFVAQAIFGGASQALNDQTVVGIGIPMTTFEYQTEILTEQGYCTHLLNHEQWTIELEQPEYIVEINDPKREQEYLIEFVEN